MADPGDGPLKRRDEDSAVGRDAPPGSRDGPPGWRDAPLGSRDGPPGWRDAPLGSRDGPPGWRDAPLGSRDTPPGWRDAPLGSRDGPPGWRDAPLGSRDTPPGWREDPPDWRGWRDTPEPRDGPDWRGGPDWQGGSVLADLPTVAAGPAGESDGNAGFDGGFSLMRPAWNRYQRGSPGFLAAGDNLTPLPQPRVTVGQASPADATRALRA